MVKKKIELTETYILPSDNNEMRDFVKKFKLDMMENIVSNIKSAIENKLDIVEVFSFKKSPFVVTISQKEFDINLEHIEKFYKDNQIFESLPRVQKVRQLLKNKL